MAPMSHEPGNELMGSLDKLFKEGTYSDLTITCGDDEYRVHKTIVCPRSSFFANACNGPFEEGRTGIVALPDDDPQAVKLMIRYFYYLDYPKEPETPKESAGTPNGFATTPEANWIAPVIEAPPKLKMAQKGMFGGGARPDPRPAVTGIPNLTIHAKVYALGEKYDIKGLKTVSLGKFQQEARIYLDSDDFIRAIEEVYTSTIDQDRGMRDAVVEAIRQQPTILNKKPVQDVVRRLDLCFDLMMRFRPGNR